MRTYRLLFAFMETNVYSIGKHFPIAAMCIFFCMSISSCKKKSPVDRGVYYWRSTFSLSAKERRVLDSCKVQKLYTKYFELAKDANGNIYPATIIAWIDSLPVRQDVVPVVFIPNNTLLNASVKDMAGYADKIYKQIALVHPVWAKPFYEMQIDCDWTDKTRDVFFALLMGLQKQCEAQHILLTTTLRLHQIKYKAKAGIPPVKRCLLMFYNMGKFDTSDERISILDLNESSKYIKYIKDYPLPLDVALPVFGWGVQMRGGKAINLLHNFDAEDATLLPYLHGAGNNLYKCDSSLFYRGIYLQNGDLLKAEWPEYNEIVDAEKKLMKMLPNQQRSLILFDLDSDLIKHYDEQKIQGIYTHLH